MAGSEKEKNRKRKPSEFLLFKEFWGLFGMISVILAIMMEFYAILALLASFLMLNHFQF